MSTSKPQLLNLELRLLVARHGKERVLEALSQIEDAGLGSLEDAIKTFETEFRKPKKKARRRPHKSIQEMVDEANPAPEARELLEKLAKAYEERGFLPELRQAKRFLESRGTSAAKLRSRVGALPLILRELAKCSIADLQRLVDERRGRGDLGIIADQILGHGRNVDRGT